MKKTELPYHNLVDLLQAQAAVCPDKTAFTCITYDDQGRDRESSIRYRELDEKARALAVYLKQRGLRAGERTLIFSTQSLDNIISIFGTLYAGGVVILNPPPIDPGKQQRFQSVLTSARPKFLLCNTMVFERMMDSLSRKAAETLSTKLPAFVGRFLPRSLPKSLVDFILKVKEGFEVIDVDQCRGNPEAWVFPEISSQSLAALQYSSGSTAAPKGCMVTHGNILSVLETFTRISHLPTEIPLVHFIPLFHNMGLLGGVFYGVFTQARSVIMSPLDFLEKPIRWLELISRFKAGLTSAPNSAYQLLARVTRGDDLKHIDLSSLCYAINASEVISLPSLEAFAETFCGAAFRFSCFKPGYGLSETTSGIYSYFVDDDVVAATIDYRELKNGRFVELPRAAVHGKSIVACGRVSSSPCRVRIVDPQTHRILREGDIGEIWLAGDMVVQGYWRQPQASRETFANRLPGEDGLFLRTGDLGTVVDDQLYITGRIKELIIIHGKNYYPTDIESAVKATVPELIHCSTASFSLMRDGREVLVIVIETDAVLPNFQEIAVVVMHAIQEFFQFSPYDVVFIKKGALQRSDTGKIQILKTKGRYENHTLDVLYAIRWPSPAIKDAPARPRQATVSAVSDHTGGPVALSNPVVRELTQYLADAFQQDPNEIDIHLPITHYGLDSLALVEFIATIEDRFSCSLNLRGLSQAPTIASLSSMIQDRPRPKKASKDKIPPITRARSGEKTLLSYQEALLFKAMEWGDSKTNPAHKVMAVFELVGSFDVDIFQQAFQHLINRHEALRTGFLKTRNGMIRTVCDQASPVISTWDLSTLDPDQQAKQLHQMIALMQVQEVDLAKPPLGEIRVVKVAKERWQLFFCIHHLICDGWSMGLLSQELSIAYNCLCHGQKIVLPEISLDYSDYAAWQHRCRGKGFFKSDLDYWADTLSHAEAVQLPKEYRYSSRLAHATDRFHSLLADNMEVYEDFTTQRSPCRPYL